MSRKTSSLFAAALVGPALLGSVRKLDPRAMIRNPVMFVVEVVAALTTVLFLRDLATGGADLFFSGQIVLWLWFTLLFANFAILLIGQNDALSALMAFSAALTVLIHLVLIGLFSVQAVAARTGA